MHMTTYEIHPTSTVYMNGTAVCHLKERGLPGIVATLRIGVWDFETLQDILREQARKAWDEGAEAAWARSTPSVNGQDYQWRHEGDPVNPYTAQTATD